MDKWEGLLYLDERRKLQNPWHYLQPSDVTPYFAPSVISFVQHPLFLGIQGGENTLKRYERFEISMSEWFVTQKINSNKLYIKL